MNVAVDRQTACRFLVRRSGLGRLAGETWRWPQAGDTPAAGTVAAAKALEYVQVDPMSVLSRNHELVLAARVDGFAPEVLDSLLYRDHALVEVVAFDRCIVPAEDYPLFRLSFRLMERQNRPRLLELEPVMREVLARVEAEGPLSSLDFEDDRRIRGWWDLGQETNTKAVRQAMEWLWHFGRLGISRREGLRRYLDLPERVWGGGTGPGGGVVARPGEGTSVLEAWDAALDGDPVEERRILGEGMTRKYCRAMGLSNPKAFHFGWERYPIAEREALALSLVASGELVPVRIEGVGTTYYVPTAEADDLVSAAAWEPAPEIRFLPPLDNLIWDRRRLADLWEFDYVWEGYVPPAKRKYGPYTCPILWGDVLVGRIDARVDRGRPGRKRVATAPATLVVNGVWWEEKAATPAAATFWLALREWASLNGASEVVDLSGSRP